MRKLLLLILLMSFLFSCEKDNSDLIEEIEEIEIEEIEIDGVSIIYEGYDYQYICNIYPENAENKNIEWSVSDQTLLNVSDSGKVVALKKGTVSLYAETTDGTDIKAELSITIVGKPKVNITFNNDSKFYKAVFSITSENLDFGQGFTNKVLVGKTSDLTLESSLYTYELAEENANNDFEIFNLTPDTTYYIRTFNINHPDGSEYSPEIKFTMPSINITSINQTLGAGNVKIIDEYVFYRNYNDDGKLYRYNTITNENIKILDYKWCFSIHQYKNFLVVGGGFSSYFNPAKIFKCKLDGTEIETLIDVNANETLETWDAFVIENDMLYLSSYNNGNYLGKYNLLTKEYVEIAKHAFSITLQDNYLYYKNLLNQDVYDIMRTNIINNQTEVLLTYDPTGGLNKIMPYGNSVYFIADGLIGRFSIDNPVDLNFYNASVSGYIVYDDFIYYLNTNDNNSLYKMDISESLNIKLSDIRAESYFSIINDKIYFFGIDDKNLYSIGTDGADEKLVIQ